MTTTTFTGHHRVTARSSQGTLECSEIDVFDEGVKKISVREVVDKRVPFCDSPSILLVDGLGSFALRSVNLPIRGGSLAGEIASMGWTAYVMGVRAFEHSTRPAQVDAAVSHLPLAWTGGAVVDIDAILRMIARRKNRHKITLLGWATDEFPAGLYASLSPAWMIYSILIDPSYSGSHQRRFRDETVPFNCLKRSELPGAPAPGAYRPNTTPTMISGFDPDFSIADDETFLIGLRNFLANIETDATPAMLGPSRPTTARQI